MSSSARAINAILTELRVPELPYPVGKPAATAADWRPLLVSCWQSQADRRVIDALAATDEFWSVEQVNAAYLADRVMDVFLRSSGLHPELVRRLARLRFLLASRLVQDTRPGFEPVLTDWLDGFEDWRGWSDSGGRSARALTDRLDALVPVVTEVLAQGELRPFAATALQWQEEALRRRQHSSRLHERLLHTEQGAARQRYAEQSARAAVGRALEGRSLPLPVIRFVVDTWLPLLRQAAWTKGTDSDDWRHGMRLLEWVIWVGDPVLSRQNSQRLYQVGEQLVDRIAEVWGRIYPQPMPEGLASGIEQVLVEKLRGGEPQCQRADRGHHQIQYDSRWLTEQIPAAMDQATTYTGQWFVEGDGSHEQRRYLLAVLEESADVIWTNGYGVKLGVMPWDEFRRALDDQRIRPLPASVRFGQVATDTLTALARVVDAQRSQRQQAAKAARERAEQRRQEEEQARARAEAEARERALEEARREALARQEQAREAEEIAARERQQRVDKAQEQVDGLQLGGWVAVQDDTSANAGERRLKLAVRINASRKLIFVDRHGLNRTEIAVPALVEALVEGRARVLGGHAEFDETLSRVVGRIRVGR